MSTTSGLPEEWLRTLAMALVPHVRELLSTNAAATEEYFDQTTSPLGRRKHLELVRHGTLPGRKVGRRILIRKDLVCAYIESQRPTAAVAAAQDDPLNDWGIDRQVRP